MNKTFKYVLILFFCVSLVGILINTEKLKNKINSASNKSNDSNETTTENKYYDNGKWISTDDKLVFKYKDGHYMIYTFDEQKLQGVQWITDFEDKDLAQKAYVMYRNKYDKTYEVSIDGTIVTLAYNQEYVKQKYGSISKEDLEIYMEKSGYVINKK